MQLSYVLLSRSLSKTVFSAVSGHLNTISSIPNVIFNIILLQSWGLFAVDQQHRVDRSTRWEGAADLTSTPERSVKNHSLGSATRTGGYQ